jgi:hypothetical protein
MLAELGFIVFLLMLALGLIRHYQGKGWDWLRLALLTIAGLSTLGCVAVCFAQEGGWEIPQLRSSRGREDFVGGIIIIFAKMGPTYTGLILLGFSSYLIRKAYVRWLALKAPADEAGQ